MRAVVDILEAMVPYMELSAVVWLLLRSFVWLVIKLREKKINWYHEAGLLLFVMFLVGLASQTVLPKMVIDSYGVRIIMSGAHETRLLPLRVIRYTYNDYLHHNYYSLIINLLGNIVIFMPLGFFLPLLWRRSGKAAIAVGFFVSLLIELIQLFLPRWTDIDDLILNTIGAALGVLLFKLLHLMAGGFLDRFANSQGEKKTHSV